MCGFMAVSCMYYVCMHVYMHACMCVSVCVCLCMYVWVCVRVCMSHTNTNTYTRTHTYTRAHTGAKNPSGAGGDKPSLSQAFILFTNVTVFRIAQPPAQRNCLPSTGCVPSRIVRYSSWPMPSHDACVNSRQFAHLISKSAFLPLIISPHDGQYFPAL